MTRPVFVAGSGSYLPGDPVPFDEIDRVLGTPEGTPDRIRRWMAQTHGIMRELLAVRFFHYAIDPETRRFTDDNVTMSVKAARRAIEMAGLRPEDVDLICYGSAHQDQMPTASVRIQEALGIETCQELSIHANCTSAYKALYLAHELVGSGRSRCALVVSSSMASSELRAEYYNAERMDKESLFLRWFLCDGAGAVLLTADEERSAGLVVETTAIESIGGKRPSLMFNLRPAYWMNPREEFEGGLHHLRQRFRNALSTDVFREKEGSVFLGGLRRMLERGAVPVGKIRFFQVNLPARHIVESVLEECEGLGIPRSAFYTKLDELGYCGPPMVFICLDRILREETLRADDRVVSFVTEVSKFMQAGYSLRHV